jgi:hypothetical protein
MMSELETESPHHVFSRPSSTRMPLWQKKMTSASKRHRHFYTHKGPLPCATLPD